MFKKSELLDCTLRDGGYYTNWDFDKSLVDEYIEVMNRLPIDYLELGYRNPVDKSYMGKYGYCPSYELEDIRSKSKKKLAVMVNEKSVKPEDMDAILGPVRVCRHDTYCRKSGEFGFCNYTRRNHQNYGF